jgi:phosphopantetheine binding protein/AMP-binding enzyme
VVNIYGLTEISDVNAFAVIGSREQDRPVTIGQPLQNNQLYILNRRRQLQPVGVVGELCIAGESLARGYLNRPELTAEKFLPSPFVTLSSRQSAVGSRQSGDNALPTAYCILPTGERLCATGDLARWRADGSIELLGRLDHQIKVRGFRIEVGEIEALLAGQASVRECVVVARADVPGETRLVAYVVTSNELQVTSSSESPLVTRHSSLVTQLRAALKQQLPDYMVPSAFVVLDRLPKTPNGKIDRKALPPPDLSGAALEAAYVAPRTPTEERVVGIWAHVLRVERVGVHDNFFELGGHSLLATQVLYRVRETFQIELPLHTIFMDPTVASMAQAIDQSQPQQRKELPTIQARPRGNKSVDELLAKLDQLSESEIKQLLLKKDT